MVKMVIPSILSLAVMRFMVTFGLPGMIFNGTERRAMGCGIVTNAKLLPRRNTTSKNAIFVATGMDVEKIAL